MRGKPERIAAIGGLREPKNTLYNRLIGLIKSWSARKRLQMSTTTGFFRNVCQMETLERLCPSASKAYVFGCSAGCEAYSLAIHYQSRLGNRDLRVEGFDIDGECVERARQGIYRRDEVDYYRAWDVLPEVVEKNFSILGIDSYQINESIRRRCTFRIGSVLDSDLFLTLPEADLVVCQNVMIHMPDWENLVAVENLLKVLRPNGLLVIGGMRSKVRSKIAKCLGLLPVTDEAESIHEGWLDLRGWWDLTPSWRRKYYCLEPIKKGKDWELRYCTIFRQGVKKE